MAAKGVGALVYIWMRKKENEKETRKQEKQPNRSKEAGHKVGSNERF